MVVIGGAAGAVLAVATVPAFAPYKERESHRPASVTQASTMEPPVQEPGHDFAPQAVPQGSLGALDVFPGEQDGTIVLELPQWTHDGMKWMLLARRAMREWHDMTAPDDHAAQDYYREEERPGPRHRWRYEPSYGYDAPHGSAPRDRDFDENSYARPERPQPPVEPGFRPAPQVPPSAFDRAFPPGPSARGSMDREIPKPDRDDAAATAARRAREAAQDVLSAERAAQ